MACISPVSMVKTTEGRKYNVTVPCGKCLNCLEKRRADWTFRIQTEMQKQKSAFFITLTYNDESLPVVYIGQNCSPIQTTLGVAQSFKGAHSVYPTLRKRDFQLFMKRLRQDCEKGYYTDDGYKRLVPGKGHKIKYYAVGEYGTKSGRPHYHAIIFGLPKNPDGILLSNWTQEGNSNKKLGFVHVGDVTVQSIHYVTGYTVNKGLIKNWSNWSEEPFSLISNRPAIGKEFIDDLTKRKIYENGKYKKTIKNNSGETYNFSSQRVALPRYYADKIYGIKEKQRIAEEKTRRFDEMEDKRYRESVEKGENFYESAIINYKQKIENFNAKSKKSKF